MTSRSLRVVVVGSGMASVRLAEDVRAWDPDGRVALTVFGAEPHPPYNRLLLSNVLAGRSSFDDIVLTDPSSYERDGGGLRLGTAVRSVDRSARRVTADDGTVVDYDALVFATGSTPILPPVEGLVGEGGVLRDGAFVFRTLDDCREVARTAANARRAVVIGGGLLGVETARGLAQRGLIVTLVHADRHLMERQLDETAGRILRRTLAMLGIDVTVGTTVQAVTGTGRVDGVILADGSRLPTDLLVVACGVYPDVRLARDSGLAVERGIVVDDYLRSVTDPDVYAIGDCAQHDGEVRGLVAPAWDQARVVACHLTGADPSARYSGSPPVARLKAAGVDLAAMGEALADDDEAEVVLFADPHRGTYKKLVVRDHRLVGAILLGDADTVGIVTQFFDRGSPVPPDRKSLLFARLGADPLASTPAGMPEHATVCHCNGVSKAAIRRSWLAGARGVGDVVASTRATTGCGSCRGLVQGIVESFGPADDLAPRSDRPRAHEAQRYT